jgi:Ser/Thr protein kinase RdoA (MazF antagonist)
MTGLQTGLLQATYATATADAVAAFVAARYDLPGPLECILLQRGFNDSFAVRTADQTRYVLRMSGRRRRGDADVDSETRFLAFLDSAGVPVSTAVPNRAGALFCEADMPEGPRPAVLFRHAEGRAPKLDAPEDARAQGVTLACIHDAAENFPDRETGRYRLDLNHLLHRQVAAVIELKEVKEETRSYLLELSSRLDASVGALPDLSWTRCHGDCHGVNARIDGYRAIRPITPADFDAVALFVPVRHLWLMGEYAGRVAEWGTESMTWLGLQEEFLRTWEAEKLSPSLFG